MFRCQKCFSVTKTRQPINRVVTDKRTRKYEREIKRGPDRGQIEIIEGWEIVKELNACPTCYTELTGLKAKLVEVVERPVPLPENERAEKPQPQKTFHRIKVDKDDPRWRQKAELEAVRRRESRSDEPERFERKKPVVEVVKRQLNAPSSNKGFTRASTPTNSRINTKG